MYGHDDLARKLDFVKMKALLNEVNGRLALINQRDALENASDNTSLINMALENIIFSFRKVSEEELELGIVDYYVEQLRKTREAMLQNYDKSDPVYVSLADELERIYRKKKLTEITTEDLQENTEQLRSIYDRITEQNRRDNLIKYKYHDDEKFARIHKRIVEQNPEWRLTGINRALLGIKNEADERILHQRALLGNETYFTRTLQPIVVTSFNNNSLTLDLPAARQINSLVVNEYLKEYRGDITA